MPPLQRMMTETERAALKAALGSHPLAQIIDQLAAVTETCYSCEHLGRDNETCLHFGEQIPREMKGQHHEQCYQVRTEDPF